MPLTVRMDQEEWELPGVGVCIVLLHSVEERRGGMGPVGFAEVSHVMARRHYVIFLIVGFAFLLLLQFPFLS